MSAFSCHWLLRQPVGMQVFDSTKDFKLCGAGLGISANGLKALRAISPGACRELEDTSRKPSDNQPTLMFDDEGKQRVKHSGEPCSSTPWKASLKWKHDGVAVWGPPDPASVTRILIQGGVRSCK